MSLKLIPVPAKSKKVTPGADQLLRSAKREEASKTCSIGMAKPIPCVPTRTAVLTPRTCPASLINGPPLLRDDRRVGLQKSMFVEFAESGEDPRGHRKFETRRISNGVQTIALAHFAGTCVLEIGTGTRRSWKSARSS